MLSDGALRLWEWASYLVTVLGLPVALWALWREMRSERANEAKEIEQREEEIYVSLSQQYSAFLEAALANPDLELFAEGAPPALTDRQRQQRAIYFEMLIALFERAYILLYEEGAPKEAARRWQSWADYIDWWLRKPDFCAYASTALEGEDPDFAAYIRARMAAA